MEEMEMKILKSKMTILLMVLFVFACVTPEAKAAAHQVTVATSGGDYNSISAALGAINPTAQDPYVIDVLPGTYIESFTMKGYVHLRGSGRDVTIIRSPSGAGYTISASFVSGPVMISGFTITGTTTGGTGIEAPLSGASLSIFQNTISGVATGVSLKNGHIRNNIIRPWNSGTGILVNNGGAPTIAENDINGSGNATFGIVVSSASPQIVGNEIVSFTSGIGVYACPSGNNSGLKTNVSHNTIAFNNIGVRDCSSSPTLVVSDNYMTGNNTGVNISKSGTDLKIIRNTITESTTYGIRVVNGSGSPALVTHNRVTGGGSGVDITVDFATVNISFNVYDTFSGSGTKIGSFNVRSDGTPWN